MTKQRPASHRRRRPRHALRSRDNGARRGGKYQMLVGGRILLSLASIVVLLVAGSGWAGERGLLEAIVTSQVLEGEPDSPGGDQNILIIGLDSRLDQYGRPLPPELYEALHAGDETAGGYNANVLIVLHVPGDGGPSTAISIPRDDYVDLAGCPSGVCKEKIKQAYGLAYQQALNASDAGTSGTATEDQMAREQLAREAGRRAEITTVRQLLGIPIDHFVEVTLAAFFQIAEVVQPLTVCLNEDTSDPYSGADFHRGVQQIDAAQAMAFVRQRRAVRDETFTDLDRTRRQQAFIASLMVAVRNSGVLSRPSALRNLVDVVEQNVAVDAGFDFAGFIKRGAKLTESGLSLYTLPIAGFGQTSAGEQINIIDVPTIRSIVRDLVSTGTPAAKPLAVLDVVNASSYEGLAAAVRDALAASSFTAGTASSADTRAQTSRIDYGPGAQAAAEALADQLNLTASASDTVAADRVRLTIGADFPADDYLTGTAEPSAVPTAAATATGTQAPVPTELSRMSATGGIPCVK